MTKMRATAAGAVLMPCLLAATPSFANCNSGNVARDALLSSSVCQATAIAAATTAVSSLARAEGGNASAYGDNARALGKNATAIGSLAGVHSSIDGMTVLGTRAGLVGMGYYATAIGAGSSASTSGPRADGAYGIAIGGSDLQLGGAFASGLRSIAIGQASVAGTGGGFGTSVGFNARSGFAGTAIGTDASALGLLGPVAVGRFAGAGGQQATALGPSANASALRTVALGHAARATHARSVAIGDGSISGGVDTVSVGSTTKQRRIVNVAAAKKNTDAVNLKQVRDLIRDATRSGAGAAATATSGLPAGNVAIGRVRHAALAGAARAANTTKGASENNAPSLERELDEEAGYRGWANVAANGDIVAVRHVTTVQRISVGYFRIGFERRGVERCALNAVLAEAGFIAVKPGKDGGALEVETRNRFGVLADVGFYVSANC